MDLCFTERHIADDEHTKTYLWAHTDVLLNVTDVRRGWHVVNLTATAFGTLPGPGLEAHDTNSATVQFNLVSVDDVAQLSLAAFLADFDLVPEKRLRTLSLFRTPQVINITEFKESFMVAQPVDMDDDEKTMKGSLKDDISDIDDELESLMLLEHEAARLDAEISARKSKIYGRIRQQNSEIPLREVLQQCDGIVCAARAIAERICNKVGVNVQPQYVQMRPHLQQMLGYAGGREPLPQNARNCTKSQYVVAESLSEGADEVPVSTLSAASVKNGTRPAKLDLNNGTRSNNVLIHVLSIIASSLGIFAICALIRQKCMSMRKRVERAADREERRNARAYRRAARRALMRKRWNDFVSTVTCFRTVEEPRVGDYEEKRALILQDAFLEQELDQAEKGQLTEAEIRELRHAHEIVASLVRSGESSHVPARDPPPPLVPLPHTPGNRSRASTATLPSYTSESLPDYTSSPEDTEGSTTVVDGFRQYTPTNSDDDGRYTPAPSSTTGSSSTSRNRYTPVSSVAAISPRCSAETLRTRQSKDSRE